MVHRAGGARVRIHRQGRRSGIGEPGQHASGQLTGERIRRPQARHQQTARFPAHREKFPMNRPGHQMPMGVAHGNALGLPQARYILPSFVERTSYGVKESNPYNKLFEERIIFLGVQIDDASANDVMAQLLTLESTDPDREIVIYINSPGGSFTSMTAIYDTMQFVRPHIRTVCLGQAASAAAVILAAGSAGMRMALPNSRILIHQPATEGVYGQVSDLEIQAKEIQRMRNSLEEILARHSNKTPDEVRMDIERDKILTAAEAKEYGLVDDVLEYRKIVDS